MVVLDSLTRREWVAEEDLAADLKVPLKVMRRVLRYLEQAGAPASCHIAGQSIGQQLQLPKQQ